MSVEQPGTADRRETNAERIEAEVPLEDSQEYLTFRLDQEEFAVPIGLVKEIRAWEPVTRIPHAADYECGLVNIRGAIVPILDLRKRLALPAAPCSKHTVVVLFALSDTQGKTRTCGAVVDALSDVVRFRDRDIQPPPQLARRRSLRFASGVVEHGQRMVVMLDSDLALQQAFGWS